MVLAISTLLVAVLAAAVIIALNRHEAREFLRQDLHERNALERERRALERHDIQMKALEHNRAMTLQAINQRVRLEEVVVALDKRVSALEAG
jgi:hypothetical protein